MCSGSLGVRLIDHCIGERDGGGFVERLDLEGEVHRGFIAWPQYHEEGMEEEL